MTDHYMDLLMSDHRFLLLLLVECNLGILLHWDKKEEFKRDLDLHHPDFHIQNLDPLFLVFEMLIVNHYRRIP
ncbi:MAG: hypothetical protein ACJA01_003408 [Saprospiraceae bacterium]|jgi:hypothetical protein